MRMYTLVLVFLLLMIIVPDLFFYRKLKNREARPIFIFLHLIPPVFFSILFIYIKFELESQQNFRIVAWVMWLYFFFLLIYIPKLIHVLFYFLNFIYEKIFSKKTPYFTIARIILSTFVVISMLIGAYITPRKFEVTRIQLRINNLPKAFYGYKIVQISDLHLGSWNNKYERLAPVIRLINRENADIVVFTGDMVNNFSGETDGWKPYFLQISPQSAKYAILGNHDYGDYSDWENEAQRKANAEKIKQSIREFGFRLLLNEHIQLKKGSDSIALIGVENWGKTRKHRYSNIAKAMKNCPATETKILLSHDPNHWDAEILGKKDIVLTLSGHTHAAQLGIKIGEKLFSPASFVFKYWSGLYKINEQYLYVNRGIGYIGLPMQIGVRPEITVIELIN